MPNSAESRIARIDERLNAIDRALSSISDELKIAADGRRRSYEASERVEREIIGITHRLVAVEKSVDMIRPTTDELERVRDRVAFAGVLGRTLWGVGKALLSAAAGAAAAYYSLTGRPPP